VFYGGDDSCYCGNSGFLDDENQRSKVKDSPGEEEWDQSVRSECGEGTPLKPCGLKRKPQIHITANVIARIFSFLDSFISVSLLPLLSSSSRQVSRWQCRGRLGGR